MKKESPRNTISTLTGIILLVFVLAFFLDREVFRIPIRLGSFSIVLILGTIDLVSPAIAAVAALAVYGMTDRGEPVSPRTRLVHTFLPFAGTWTFGVSLRNNGGGLGWWLLLFFGGFVLYLVMMSEYIVCDQNDQRSPLASILLTGLSYAVFLVAVVAVRVNITRLALEFPLIVIITFFLSVRIFSFWLEDWNVATHSAIMALLMLIASAGLHYWPINSISYGILMFIWYYLLVNIEILLSQGSTIRESLKRQVPVFVILAVAFAYTEFLLM